ncbi:23S rRNA (uracil(1939)-C(5))-methyltransferase RlmD [Terrimonas pollutisoli]|uniref:23S rRNA (uracil(1939)-C(5))-methyltransferase RlmD n=1 Tax=Terrimonas pollutisoli TaxID=3034147 RepID=UPI0023EB3995|nr:23S rRNA (uracil(1939)-C(5))-methyltransferase RlmD [Terrimonas sp. H1YJ31]
MSRKKKNIVLEKIRVEDYAAEGKSLAKVDGKVIFIEGVVPGDVVDVQLGRNKKDWAEGRPLRFHSLSPDRVEPFCSHFGVCGGCQWQMLPYEKQLQYKQRQVKDNLQRIGKVQLPEMMPILGAKETRYYRNKIEYTFGNKRFLLKEELNDPLISSQQNVAGFHAKGMFDKLVDIQTCYLQEEPTNALRLAIKKFALNHNYSFYDIRNHTGFLRTMQVRLCTTGELMVNIVFGEKQDRKIKVLLDHILDLFPGITTLLYTINMKKNDSLHDLEPVIYSGKGYVIEKLEDFSFKIGPKSFFQTNSRQGEALYKVTRDFAELTGNETVYDLYCGTGSIGIFVSRSAKKIIGVEMIAAAIEDAKENAALNNLNDTAFFAGDVIDVCNDEFFADHGRPDVIITDPPRAGMHEKLVRKILDMAAPTVVYVSCNPATQARDLNLLNEKYEVKKIQPVDMFPHTLHIENVVQLKLR